MRAGERKRKGRGGGHAGGGGICVTVKEQFYNGAPRQNNDKTKANRHDSAVRVSESERHNQCLSENIATGELCPLPI